MTVSKDGEFNPNIKQIFPLEPFVTISGICACYISVKHSTYVHTQGRNVPRLIQKMLFVEMNLSLCTRQYLLRSIKVLTSFNGILILKLTHAHKISLQRIHVISQYHITIALDLHYIQGGTSRRVVVEMQPYWRLDLQTAHVIRYRISNVSRSTGPIVLNLVITHYWG